MNQNALAFWPVCPVEFGRRMCAAARKRNIEPTHIKDSRGGEHLALPAISALDVADLLILAAEAYTRPGEPNAEAAHKALIRKGFGFSRGFFPDGEAAIFWPGVPDPVSLASLAYPEPALVPRGVR